MGAPPDANILMLSRLARGEDYKGHRQVLGVWARVRARVPNAQLWIAGDGDLRGALEEWTRANGLPESVRFFGRVSDTQKNELLRACRALAMPSRGEGFGLVYVEAMRAGRPCLVSDADAGREVVNPPEAGLAVNPDDADALTDALVRLLASGDEWNAWSRAAQKRYAEHFTAAQFQNRLLDALREVW
jgi:phosphatidylinositol alpha-1,6-mannosyltransferase